MAADAGADWVLSGELVVPGYRFEPLIGTTWIAKQPDRWMGRLARLSSDLEVASFVSHPEREARTRKLFNSLFVIGRNGQILRTAAEARPDARQRRLVERRRTRSPIPVDGITVGLLLCADAYRHCRRNACATLVRSCSSHPRRGGRATCQFSDGPIAKCELTESTVLRPQ